MDTNLVDQVNRSFSEAHKATIKKNNGTNMDKKDRSALHDACRGFESIFLDTMLESMRKTVPEDKLFGDGNGMDIYKSMYDEYLAENISENGGGIGLESFLYKQIDRSKF